MPFDFQLDIPFMVGYVGYIMNLIKFNGVPVYLIMLALMGVMYFAMWLGYLVQLWRDRFINGGN